VKKTGYKKSREIVPLNAESESVTKLLFCGGGPPDLQFFNSLIIFMQFFHSFQLLKIFKILCHLWKHLKSQKKAQFTFQKL